MEHGGLEQKQKYPDETPVAGNFDSCLSKNEWQKHRNVSFAHFVGAVRYEWMCTCFSGCSKVWICFEN